VEKNEMQIRQARHIRCGLSVAWLMCWAAAAASAQTTTVPTGPITLEQALALAEARSESIAIARAGVQRAEGEQVRARSGRLPQLSASASYDRALASEFEGIFDAGAGPACAPFAPNPAAALPDRVSEIERAIDCGAIGNPFAGGGDDGSRSLPFGRTNTWRLNLVFSQSLYSGGRLDAQAEIAENGHTAAELALTSARAQLLFDVTQAYYDAALSKQVVAIAEATIQQAEATLRQVNAGFTAGTQPEFELLRARVALESQTPPVIRQRANREIALLRLKQLLELPPDADLELEDSLDRDVLPPPAPFGSRLAEAQALFNATRPSILLVQSAPLPDRTAVKEAATVVQLREAALKAARAERLPNVTLNSSYGRVSYPPGAWPRLDDFRTNWTVGATLQVPILTGGRLRGDELVARAELAQTRLELQRVEELAALDTRSAWAELLAAQATWEASAGTVQQASRAYAIADVRYRAGVSTQLELSDARLQLQQADVTRAQAARDLQVARARVALLPELPLGQGAGGTRAPVQQPGPTVPSTPTAPLGGGQFRNASTGQPQPLAGVVGGVRQE
jgi:outer membrane protein TolC